MAETASDQTPAERVARYIAGLNNNHPEWAVATPSAPDLSALLAQREALQDEVEAQARFITGLDERLEACEAVEKALLEALTSLSEQLGNAAHNARSRPMTEEAAAFMFQRLEKRARAAIALATKGEVS